MLQRRQVLLGATGIAATFCFDSRVWAHRESKTHTKIVYKADLGKLHVTHSFHTDDAEMALRSAGISASPDLFLVKSRAQLALYTEQHFVIRKPDDTPVQLQIIGAETPGDRCYVYQDADMPSQPSQLTISCRLMHGLIPDQVNYVDVHNQGRIQSFRFTESAPQAVYKV